MKAIFAVVVAFTAASAQTPQLAVLGAADMVLSVRGVPLIAEQVEERTGKLDDGTSAAGTVKGKVFRDSAGRLRVDSELIGNSGKSLSTIRIYDPVAHSVFVLLNADKLAFRMVSPEIVASELGPFPWSFGYPHPTGEWGSADESLGKKTIEGIQCEGSRTTETLLKQPSVTETTESWRSEELGITLLAVFSGQKRGHTAKLQNVLRREPAPELFAVPPDYTVTNLDIPKLP
jgi:hypothetical protein